MINLKKTILLIGLSLFLFSNNNALAKDQTYIFVSFSMNDKALKSYFVDAQKYEAILVMRGLLNNSFQETQHKTAQLAINFNIDPIMFEQYEITEVPVILQITDKGQIKKLTGHVPLAAALEIMEDKF